jgi:MSHA biogenesis protein MshJ
MKAGLATLAARFDAISRRERAMVAAAIVVGILLLGSTAFIEPALKRDKLAATQMQQQQAELANVRAQIEVTRARLQDPEKSLRASLDETRRKDAVLEADIEKFGNALVPPQRMAALLEELVTRNRGLRLLAIHSLPPQPLIERKSADAVAKSDKPTTGNAATDLPHADKPGAPPPANLYRHGVEIRVEGSYADLNAYLAGLERLPQRVLWGSIGVDAERYPQIVMTVTVYTLSLEKSWLIV